METQPKELILNGRLPKSAQEFKAYHVLRDQTILMPSFLVLLRRKIGTLVASGENFEGFTLQHVFDQAVDLYRDVDFKDVPIYQRSIKNLETLAEKIGARRLVMYGRDADYLAAAVVAHEYGRVPVIEKPVLLSISREIGYHVTGDGRLHCLIRELFEQHGIDRDFIHVDIGKYGNVPRSIIRALWPELNDEAVDARIRLVHPYHKKKQLDRINYYGREMTWRQRLATVRKINADPKLKPIEGIGEVSEFEDDWYEMGYKAIESRPHSTLQASRLEQDPETGWIRIVRHPASKPEQLMAWVVNQAVVRTFLPRLPRPPFWRRLLRV